MIPLQLFFRVVTGDRGCWCAWQHPDVVELLEKHPGNGTLFYIEHTSAARGPVCVWYPVSAWHEEQTRQAGLERLIAQQYVAVEEAKERKRAELIVRIGTAKKRGDVELIRELRKELANCQPTQTTE